MAPFAFLPHLEHASTVGARRSRAMTKIGLLLPSREAVLWGGGSSIVDLAVRAEAAGFDSVWVGDSVVARPRFDPVTLLAAVAGATSSIALGTAIYLPLLRHPRLGAHTLASLDALSGGRLVVGVGPGASVPSTDEELAAVGSVGGRRVGRVVETVASWRTLWSSSSGDVAPAPARVGGPPVWLAAAGPRMLRLTGELFDGWLPYSPTVADFVRGWDAVRAAASAVGRDPSSVTAGLYATVCVSGGEDELDAYMQGYYGLPLSVMGQVQAAHAGTVAAAAEWLLSYVEAGASHVVVRVATRNVASIGDAAEELLSAMRR